MHKIYIFFLVCLLTFSSALSVEASKAPLSPLGPMIEMKCSAISAEEAETFFDESIIDYDEEGYLDDTNPQIILAFHPRLSFEYVRRFINKEEVKDNADQFFEETMDVQIEWKTSNQTEKEKTLELLRRRISKSKKDTLSVYTSRNVTQELWITTVNKRGVTYVYFPSFYTPRRIYNILKDYPAINLEKIQLPQQNTKTISFYTQRGQEKCIAMEYSQLRQIAKVGISYWEGEE